MIQEAQILERIPQRHPFLYIDKIIDRGEKSIVTQKHFGADEYFFQGHFPGDPVVPGVILSEAAFQTGALLMSFVSDVASDANFTQRGRAVVTRIKNAKFKNMVTSNETVQIHVSLEEQTGNSAWFKGEIKRGEEKVMSIEFACMLVER